MFHCHFLVVTLVMMMLLLLQVGRRVLRPVLKMGLISKVKSLGEMRRKITVMKKMMKEKETHHGNDSHAQNEQKAEKHWNAQGLSPTPFLPTWSLQQKLDAAVAMNQQLLTENKSLTADLNVKQAHCTLAFEQIEDLQKKLNAGKKKTKECTIGVGLMGITSAEGLLLWEKEKVAKLTKERQQAEKKQRHQEKEAAAQAAWEACGPTLAFSGSLNSKLKLDLVELAGALGISLDGTHNNTDRIEQIQTHLNGNPNL
ncbi:hypothetical protein BDN67DRAFT_986176 [Paxillus ammoniavirescens]|nr:hypothetical protein BDN67DRAFT_986176 [Paxillus ammoniavirescens]